MIIALSITSAFTHSDLLGKAIFLFLFFLSVLSWSIMIFYLRSLRSWKKQGELYTKYLFRAPEKLFSLPVEKDPSHPFPAIFKEIRTKSSEVLEKNRFFSEPEKQVYLSSSDLPMIESQLQKVILQVVGKLERYLFILPTIVTLAPILGLLGTVWGIFITFSQISSGGSLTGNSLILSVLSMALATTVVGLIVAIPAIIGNNYIKAEIHSLKKKMVHFSQTLLYYMEMQYRKVDPNSK